MKIRAMTKYERGVVEKILSPFITMKLEGGSREEENGKIIYHLCIIHSNRKDVSCEVKRVGNAIKGKLWADEVYLLGQRIA